LSSIAGQDDDQVGNDDELGEGHEGREQTVRAEKPVLADVFESAAPRIQTTSMSS
jgi:hypothetical protein